MWILNWYVTRGFLLAFFMAIGILTFGMTGANIVKVLDFLAQGIPLMTFLKFTLYILPVILTFTVPWAVMVAVMLVFGRLSADSEITAMRACGVSILQIVSPILLITVGLTALCLYLQIEVGPPLLGKSRDLLKMEAINQPLALFEPGRQIYYDNTIISIADKTPDGRLKGVQLYKLANKETLALDISAASGKLEMDKSNQLLKVILYDCVLHDRRSDPETRMFHKELEFAFNYGKSLNNMTLSSKPKYMTVRDLMGLIKIYRQMNKDTTKLEVELNQRIAFALSPIAFLLLGLPLAIRTSRRETSVGLFLSVILAGVFFLSIILCESFTRYPKMYPQYLLWLPNIIFQVLGAVMTYKVSQR